MALSEYEKQQFAAMTAGFAVDDRISLKKMERKDKATAMTFIALPSLEVVLWVAVGIALLFTVAGRVTDDPDLMFTSGGIGLLLIFLNVLVTKHEPVQERPETDELSE